MSFYFLIYCIGFIFANDLPLISSIGTLQQPKVFTIELTQGIIAFELFVGGKDQIPQVIMVNLTNSFDGLALPS